MEKEKLTMNERQIAALAGLSKYTATKPCVRGHDPIRYVSTGQCVKCAKLATQKWNATQTPGKRHIPGRLHTVTFEGSAEHINVINMAWSSITGQPAPPPILEKPLATAAQIHSDRQKIMGDWA